MTFIREDQIQAAFLADLKARTAITAEVAADEMKEIQPQTKEFVYPGLRVRVGPNDLAEDGCGQTVTIRVFCFSEERSSQQAMRIAGIIQQTYHSKSISASGLSQDMQFTGIQAVTVPVVRQDRRTWRSEIILTTLVSSG